MIEHVDKANLKSQCKILPMKNKICKYPIIDYAGPILRKGKALSLVSFLLACFSVVFSPFATLLISMPSWLVDHGQLSVALGLASIWFAIICIRLQASKAVSVISAFSLIISAVSIVSICILIFVSISERPDPESQELLECETRLKFIGQSLSLYAQEHGNKYPLVLTDLCSDGSVIPTDLISPSSHLSFIYCGGNLSKVGDPKTILAYDFVGCHRSGRIHFLFADGNVRLLNPREAFQEIRVLNSNSSAVRTNNKLLIR